MGAAADETSVHSKPCSGPAEAGGQAPAHPRGDRPPAAEKRESEEFEVYVTAAPMDACAYIKEAAKKAQELRIYACGGDGTLNECVNGAAGHFKRRGDALPLRHGQRLHQDVRPG